ncbi:MAG: FAD:protein FMN transferase [Alphaproteobacteria bacterium]
MVSVFTRREVIRRAKGLALATPFLSLMACDGGRQLTQVSGATMGTTYGVKIPYLPPGLEREGLAQEIARIFESVDRRMSTYRADSELSRFNAAGTEPAQVSRHTLTVVEAAARMSRLSGGVFDPTVGPLVDLWGFGPGGAHGRVPSQERIEEVLRQIGVAKLRTSKEPPALGKRQGDVRLDLSSIAKGFGIDQVAEHLDRLGLRQYLIDIGGELRGRGYGPRGALWRVGIERPAGASRAVQRVIRLGRQALATSGDYRIFFERDGQRYSHIIDPRNGRPVDHGLASVTVVAATAMEADALSTALMVLGPEAGFELAERQRLAAFFIARNGEGLVELVTRGFAPYLIA